jgi:hypothetical protein
MSINNFRSKTFRSTVLAGGLSLCAAGISLFFPAEFFPAEAVAQGQQIVWSKQEKSILEDIRDLRNLSEGNRAKTARQLALKIRQLPAGTNKQRLAVTLASRLQKEMPARTPCRRLQPLWLSRFANNRLQQVRRGPRCRTPNWRNWCTTNMCK